MSTYADSYAINKIGSKYNPKKDKREKDKVLFHTASDEYINVDDFLDLLKSIDRKINGEQGVNIHIEVTMTEVNQ